jgi:hypothetical protein
MRRLVLVPPLVAAACVAAAPAHADGGCPAGGTAPPAGAAQRQVGDLDGDGRLDTLWIGLFRDAESRTNRVVGVTTASGANSAVQISSASPIPLSALAVDAQENGGNQIIVSDGRGAHLYTFADCGLQAVLDGRAEHYGRPFLFDLQNLRDQGTGVGCSDLGDGRRLVALRAALENGQWTVRRTEVNLNGTRATTGRSDTVAVVSAQDAAVTSAQTISCGDLSIGRDGVQQP